MAKKVKKTTTKATAKKKAAPKKKAVKKTATKKKTVAKKTAVKKAVKNTAVKKAVAKKATKKRKPAKSLLTAKEVENFKELLLVKRRELLGDVTSIETDALKTSRLDASGDLSSMPIHMADLGTDNFEQEFALGLMDSERKLLNEISAALNRITEGKYGICEGTNKPIGVARLYANPWARYCIEYATMVEKGLVTEGQKVYDDEDEDHDFDWPVEE